MGGGKDLCSAAWVQPTMVTRKHKVCSAEANSFHAIKREVAAKRPHNLLRRDLERVPQHNDRGAAWYTGKGWLQPVQQPNPCACTLGPRSIRNAGQRDHNHGGCRQRLLVIEVQQGVARISRQQHTPHSH